MGSSHERAEDADPISAKPARLVAKPRVEPMRVRVIIEVMEEAERPVLKVSMTGETPKSQDAMPL